MAKFLIAADIQPAQKTPTLMDHIVAVEILNAGVGKTNLSPNPEREDWRTYDLVNGSIKAITQAVVLHATTQNTGSIQLGSVFATPVKERTAYYSRLNDDSIKSVCGTRLFTANPFVERFVYRVSKCGI